MYFYNTTFFLEESILPEWRAWLDAYYIPLIESEADFSGLRVARILSNENIGNESVSVQFEFESLSRLHFWQQKYEPVIGSELSRIFGAKALSFSTILERWQ